MKKSVNHRSSFTLIELMIVVVIIGILAAIAIPLYFSAVKKAKLSEAKIVLKRIWACNDIYYFDNGCYFGPAYDIGTDGCSEIGFSKLTGSPRFVYSIIVESPPTYVAESLNEGDEGFDGSVVGYELQLNIEGSLIIFEPGNESGRKGKGWGKGGKPGHGHGHGHGDGEGVGQGH